eukprot:1157634-Pelagomonas_calceolata.AAC.6
MMDCACSMQQQTVALAQSSEREGQSLQHACKHYSGTSSHAEATSLLEHDVLCSQHTYAMYLLLERDVLCHSMPTTCIHCWSTMCFACSKPKPCIHCLSTMCWIVLAARAYVLSMH